MPVITPLTHADIPFAVRLAQIEQWAHSAADIARISEFEPEGYLVAWHDSCRVGMVSTTSYGDYAFLGMLIVRRSARGRGVGEALMRAAIDYLHGKGVRTIELDGVLKATPLYRRLGFKDKYLSLRMFNPAPVGRRRRVVPAQDTAEAIVRFDRQCTGIDRSRVVRKFVEVYPDSSSLLKNGQVTGYAVSKPREEGFVTVGPLVAQSPALAETLLMSVLADCGGKPISIGVPEINREAVVMLMRHGFIYREPSVRMSLGKKRSYEKNVYAILSPEKG